jgi:hypothetical protein
MDRSHTVGMCRYKAKYSFSLRQISLIFFGKFCALDFSVLRSTHRDWTSRAKMDLGSIVIYRSMKDMNAREIHADMNDTLGADHISSSAVTKHLSEKNLSKSILDTDFDPKIEEEDFIDEAILGVLEEYPLSPLRHIARRIFILISLVRYHLDNSLGYRIRNIGWVPHLLSSSQRQAHIEISQDFLQVLR